MQQLIRAISHNELHSDFSGKKQRKKYEKASTSQKRLELYNSITVTFQFRISFKVGEPFCASVLL